MPGQPGNVNAVKHGLRSKRAGLVHAKLGRRFANAYGHVNQLRKAVESLLVERHGSLSLLQQARVQSLLRLEEGIRAAEKSMAETPSLDADGVLRSRYAIAQWTAQRDVLLTNLLGDTASETVDPWAILAAPAAHQAQQQAQPAAAAPAAAQPTDATTHIAEAAGTSPAATTASDRDGR